MEESEELSSVAERGDAAITPLTKVTAIPIPRPQADDGEGGVFASALEKGTDVRKVIVAKKFQWHLLDDARLRSVSTPCPFRSR